VAEEAPLRLLVLPSWYPHPLAPVLGIFSLEQTLAVADLRPSWSIAVGVWGQGEYDFALRRPNEWPRRLTAYLRARPSRRKLRPNLIEHRRPCATWARQLLGGNLRGVLRAGRELFDATAAEFGGVDLVQAHVSFPGGLVAMRLREQVGVPYVLTEHWHYPPKGFVHRDGSLDERIRAPMLAADAVVGVSTAQALDIAAWGLPRPEVVPPAVNEQEFVPGGGPSEGKIVFSAICNMEEGKGIDDLLHALRRLLSEVGAHERERVELRLGGIGGQLRRYRGLARDLGLAHCTRWLGLLSRDQVRDELRGCSCFVLPSRRESFGVVYAEAMACGKPVIAARAGGPEEIVRPDNGILIDPGNVKQLASAMSAVVMDPERWDSAAIRKSFLSRYSRPAVADRLEQVYRRVTGL
jgi:glycosyltransferase involved in cell wall biosynthesis